MRVFISADMEGVAGITDWDQVRPGAREYEMSRRLMTLECNAAIEGALEAGVQEIVVSDGHWNGRNLLAEEMHPVAEVLTGSARPLGMCQGIGPGFDAAFFIGYHAAAGSRDGTLAHTYDSPLAVTEVRLNGKVQSEAALNAAVCGYFECPLALVSGDATAISQAHDVVLEVEGVTVKEATGGHSGRSCHPAEARDRIRAGARRAIQRLDSIPLARVESPVELQMVFTTAAMADQCGQVPDVRRTADTTVCYRAEDYLQVFQLMLALTTLAAAAMPK